jgi:hypothetical protein
MAAYRYRASSGRTLHEFGCWVDGGRWHHLQRTGSGGRFRCARCAEMPDVVIERLIFTRERAR